MTTQARHSVSVAGVIVDDDRVLLIRRQDNGHWEPPGGVLEIDEAIEDGLRREIFEETGAHVHIERLTGVYKNMAQGIVALVFRCALDSAPAVTTTEAAAITWQSVADVPHLMVDAFAVRVLDALDTTSTPHVRAHDGTHLAATAAPRG